MVIVLISACIPAPPELSEPAMARTRGGVVMAEGDDAGEVERVVDQICDAVQAAV